MNQTHPPIEARGLTKRHHRVLAVDALSFDVRPGRVTGFLGPNGAGKSTTMRLIVGLDRPDGGEARINGMPYHRLRWPLREVGALLDTKAFHPGRSGRDHLKALAAASGIPRRRVAEVLDLVGLTDAAGRRAGGFSLGMAQRLGIAAAILGDPGILLLDEPTNGLDPEGIRWLRDLLRALAAEGRAVLVSSHLISEMALTADHLVIVGRGRLLADTSLASLTAEHGSLEQAFLTLTSDGTLSTGGTRTSGGVLTSGGARTAGGAGTGGTGTAGGGRDQNRTGAERRLSTRRNP